MKDNFFGRSAARFIHNNKTRFEKHVSLSNQFYKHFITFRLGVTPMQFLALFFLLSKFILVLLNENVKKKNKIAIFGLKSDQNHYDNCHVWYGLQSCGIIGPCLFKDDGGINRPLQCAVSKVFFCQQWKIWS